MSSTATHHDTSFDIMRIIAILFVLFNHTNEHGFLFFIDCGGIAHWVCMAVSVIVKIAVPLFFMISGALLLGKTEPMRVVLRKRVARIAIALVITSFVMYVFNLWRDQNLGSFSVLNLLSGIYTCSISTHLWYLYAYLGFLLTLPVLRYIAQNMTTSDCAALIALFFFTSALTALDFLIYQNTASHASHFNPFIMVQYCFYSLMGYFGNKRIRALNEAKRKQVVLALACASVLCIAATCALTEYKCSVLDNWSFDVAQSLFGCLLCFPVLATFCGLQYASDKQGTSTDLIRSSLKTIGEATFGIYLFGQIFTTATAKVFWLLKPIISDYLACWIWIIAAFALGAIVMTLLRRIPIVKKYI